MLFGIRSHICQDAQRLTIGNRTDNEKPRSSSFSSPWLPSAAIRHKLENKSRALMPSSSPYDCIFLESMLCFSMVPMTFWYQLVLLRSSRYRSNGRISNSGRIADRRSHCSATEEATLLVRKPDNGETRVACA